MPKTWPSRDNHPSGDSANLGNESLSCSQTIPPIQCDDELLPPPVIHWYSNAVNGAWFLVPLIVCPQLRRRPAVNGSNISA